MSTPTRPVSPRPGGGSRLYPTSSVRVLDVPAVDALDAAGCARQAGDACNVLLLPPPGQHAVAEHLADALNRLAAAAAVGGLARYTAALDGFAEWIREDFCLPPSGRTA